MGLCTPEGLLGTPLLLAFEIAVHCSICAHRAQQYNPERVVTR